MLAPLTPMRPSVDLPWAAHRFNEQMSHDVKAEFASSPVHTKDECSSHEHVENLVGFLRTCTNSKDLTTGITLHHDILEKGLLPVCSDALVMMYAQSGALEKANALFETFKCKDVDAWAALIVANVREGRSQHALILYEHMQQEGILRDAYIYASLLKACGIMGAEDKGKQIHEEIVNRGLLQNHIVLGNALLDMYVKCGSVAKAQHVLMQLPSRDVVSWSTIVTGHAHHGQGSRAIQCFDRMLCEGISPNEVTFIGVLKACGMTENNERGKQIHGMLVKLGLLNNNVILGCTLIDMYAKCGFLPKACRLFEELPSRNVVSWNILIAGYVQNGLGEQALKCFKQMQCDGIVPDSVTYAKILNACGAIGAAELGEQIHRDIMEQGLLEKDVVLGNALIDMYSKCGAIQKAHQALNSLPLRDVVSWNTLITSYAQQGQEENALECFECMLREGMPPDAITFRCVLCVYSHLGLVGQGCKAFLSMQTRYGLKLDLEIFKIVVDLFDRACDVEGTMRALQRKSLADKFPLAIHG